MADFPLKPSLATPTHVHAGFYGFEAVLATIGNASVTPGVTTTWVAKLVEYMPVELPWDYDVQRVWWINGSTITSSNVDFGIYAADGTKIYSTGSTAMSGASSVQYATPATTFTLPSGRYYFAWTCDNTTSRAVTLTGTANGGRLVGVLEETTGSFGLPATMTPVAFARAWGYVTCGLTRTASGF